MQCGVEALEAVEVDAGEPLGGELAGVDPAAELGDAGEGDVVIAFGKRHEGGGRGDEVVVLRRRRHAGQHGIPLRGGGEGWRQRDFARAGAALIERGHGLTPVLRGLPFFRRGQRDANELFGLGEGDGGDLRTGGRRGAEGGRRAGRRRTFRGDGCRGGLLAGLGRRMAANGGGGQAE